MAYRTQLRSCPGCRAVMAEAPLDLPTGTVELDICQGCGGAFMDFVDGTPARLARSIASEWDLGSEETPLATGPCSACDATMTLHDSLPGVMRCMGCGAVFATPLGLKALSMVFIPKVSARDPSLLERLLRALFGL